MRRAEEKKDNKIDMNPSVPIYKQAWFIPVSALLVILLWLQLGPPYQ